MSNKIAYTVALAGVLCFGVGYNLGTTREATRQCQRQGMSRLFVRDFPASVLSEPSPGASMSDSARYQNLATRWDEVRHVYSLGEVPIDYFAKDLADAREVARMGRNARNTVERSLKN